MEHCALLHVEDEDASACLFRAALDQARIGISVYRVSDGEQALAFLSKSGIYENACQPDLIVLDLNMPRVDGWTVLSIRQRSHTLQAIPVVVLSTSWQPEDQIRALSLGACRYIVKPHDFTDLVEAAIAICNEFFPRDIAQGSQCFVSPSGT